MKKVQLLFFMLLIGAGLQAQNINPHVSYVKLDQISENQGSMEMQIVGPGADEIDQAIITISGPDIPGGTATFFTTPLGGETPPAGQGGNPHNVITGTFPLALTAGPGQNNVVEIQFAFIRRGKITKKGTVYTASYRATLGG